MTAMMQNAAKISYTNFRVLLKLAIINATKWHLPNLT
jgi:hypothetical protein